MTDVYGDIIDADTIERAAEATLKAWLPSQLAHQERRRSLTQGTLEAPKSWPVISEFDPELHTQLPAVFILSPGTVGTPILDRGVYRATWRLEAAVILAASTERDARKLAALYLAAIRGALVQNRTLGGVVENCRWTGPDDHAAGETTKGRQRAVYGTAFQVDVRDVVSDRLGPTEPPDDPYTPDPAPPSPLEADITVTAVQEEETP